MNPRGNHVWSWLGHPATLIALLVLVVNDHVLKDAWPGLVTGKLSDAAGMVLAPPLLALIVRRPAAALWSVGVGFALVKSFPYGAELASAAWSVVHGPSIIRADRTDLLTLPFLAVAWWAQRSAAARPAAPRWVRALRMAVLLPLALVGVAATSAVQYPTAIRVDSTPEGIVLITDNEYRPPVISTDDGVTWHRTEPSGSSSAPSPPPSAPPRTKACSGDDPRLCYRTVPRALGVERSTNGGATWAEDWRISDDDRVQLGLQYPDLNSPDTDLTSVSVAVHDRAAGGHVVVVANGRDGFAMRDAGGRWERLGFPGSEREAAELPELGAATQEQRIFRTVALISIVALIVGLVVTSGAAIAATRAGNRRSRWWVAPWLLTGGSLLLLAFAYGGTEEWIFYPFLGLSPLAIVTASVVLAVTATATVHQGGGGAWIAEVWTAALISGSLAVIAYYLPGPTVIYWIAAPLPGLLLAWRAARRIAVEPPLTTSPMSYAAWSQGISDSTSGDGDTVGR